jgi:hypothetical protein
MSNKTAAKVPEDDLTVFDLPVIRSKTPSEKFTIVDYYDFDNFLSNKTAPDEGKGHNLSLILSISTVIRFLTSICVLTAIIRHLENK